MFYRYSECLRYKAPKTQKHSTPYCTTGQDRTGQDRTGQDRTGQDRTGQDRTGLDSITYCSAAQQTTAQDGDTTHNKIKLLTTQQTQHVKTTEPNTAQKKRNKPA